MFSDLYERIKKDFGLTYYPEPSSKGRPCPMVCGAGSSHERTIVSIPPTPPQYTVVLPTSEIHTDVPRLETEHLYPLDLCSPIPLARQLELWSIDLLLPAHVHTPSGHIGVIQSPMPNIRISALEIFVFLSSLATDSDAAESKGTQSESACDCRSPAQPSSTSTAQQSETKDVRDSNIVFGHNEVWGFDVRSEYGCSVIHVAYAGDDT